MPDTGAPWNIPYVETWSLTGRPAVSRLAGRLPLHRHTNRKRRGRWKPCDN
jgi:hypothetical protein